MAADEPATSASASAPRVRRAHALYFELLGRGGLYGVGYDFQPHPRFAVGASASFYVLNSERVMSFSPYLTAYLLGTGRHRWFLLGGPLLQYLYTPSPVPEWPGTSASGIGGVLCSGYEYRAGVLVRLFGMGTVGKGGYAPWMGVSLGWSL